MTFDELKKLQRDAKLEYDGIRDGEPGPHPITVTDTNAVELRWENQGDHEAVVAGDAITLSRLRLAERQREEDRGDEMGTERHDGGMR